MILANKIIKLRKQFGWSQEELAERTGVSRQSVSKWESAQSIPDLNKIIGIANLFGVTTDFLLKDEVETAEFKDGPDESTAKQVTLDEGLSYIKTKLTMADLTLKGVVLCVCSPMLLFFLLSLRESDRLDISAEMGALIGLIAVLVQVAWAVSFFIRSKQYEDEVAHLESGKFELTYGVHGVFSDKRQSYRSTYNRKLSIGVGLFIVSAIPLLTVAMLSRAEHMVLLMVVVIMFMVSVGLYFVIPASAELEAYNLLIREGDENVGKSETEKDSEKLAAFYWPMLVAIYLGWSLWTKDWHITWIIWPVGAVAFAALVGLMGLLKKDGNR